MNNTKSIAIETSSRLGGVALGVGGKMLATEPLGPSSRHAGELLGKLDELLTAHEIKPTDLDEVYISVGPGSFTGLRVGVTVARTLGQVCPSLKIVAVPTADVVAKNVVAATDNPVCKWDRDWKNLGVLLAAKRATAGHKECSIHATLFKRDKKGRLRQIGQSVLTDPGQLIATWPRPLLLTGEALEYTDVPSDEKIQPVPEIFHLPKVENVWRLGQCMAHAGFFTPYNKLLPIYARQPEALRLWEKRQNG